MSVHINPGSGPVGPATVEQAETNIRAFADDLATRGHHSIQVERQADRDYDRNDSDGRFCWTISVNGEPAIEIQMPGLPLDQVRWLGADQDIWQFPRLYIDDSSWIWFFALNQFRNNGLNAPSPDNTVEGGEPYQFRTINLGGEAQR